MPPISTLFAVHISDGVLHPISWIGGLLLTGGLLALGARCIRDEEIPRVAVLTAAFFVASLVHIRIGPTSVHLLLNGLVGVILGRRAALAIPLGVGLQAVLFAHGGFTTIGVNSCVMVLPALLAAACFGGLRRRMASPMVRVALVLAGSCVLAVVGIGALALLASPELRAAAAAAEPNFEGLGCVVADWLLHPLSLATIGLVCAGMLWLDRQLGGMPEFTLGMVLGLVAVLATVTLTCLVLYLGGETYWAYPALILVVAHLPIALIEGLIIGSTVAFLARVKPEMLGEGTTAS